MKNTIALFFVIGSLILLSFTGCSELKNDKTPVEPSMSVHGIGFADTTNQLSANFHAAYVRTKKYDLLLCQSCHGVDYAGGKTGQSCNSCHNKANGPENCLTCHGGGANAAPPKDLSWNMNIASRGVGAHQKHLLADTLFAKVACAECHNVPKNVKDAGHIDATDHAEIRFDSTSIFFKSNAAYNAGDVSCANTYCHGNFPGGNAVTMVWNDVTGSAAQCGTCHGDVNKLTVKEKAFPKTGHTYAAVTADCSTCHGAVVKADMTIIDANRHVNGKLN